MPHVEGFDLYPWNHGTALCSLMVNMAGKYLHYGKLTWQWKNPPFGRYLPGKMWIFHCYVSLPAGMFNKDSNLYIFHSWSIFQP